MSDLIQNSSFPAIQDFRRARRQAALQSILSRATGRDDYPLSYEEVRQAIGGEVKVERGIQEIPLEAIVGSVGRYKDFTRDFLPRTDAMEDRWVNVRKVATDGTGWPPIDVYQVGEAYFVLDGNHRVSVARQMGLPTIQASVTEVVTNLPLTTDTQPDELIIKVQLANFLERTELEQSRPDTDFSVTAPGGYRILDEHIIVHRYFMDEHREEQTPYPIAALSWHDTVYQPMVNLIRIKHLLADFPDRTETDLYIWLGRHQYELQDALGWDVSLETAAEDLAAEQGQSTRRQLSRIGGTVINAILPDELTPGTEPGNWRKERLADEPTDHLFERILVAINGSEDGWAGLEQAVQFAKRENGRLRGLHVLPDKTVLDVETSQQLKKAFRERCAAENVPGDLLIEVGEVAPTLIDRTRWNDLLVMTLKYPPGKSVVARLGSGVRQIVQRSSRPVLLVPRTVSPLTNGLLVFDGTPKSYEALFLAAYLEKTWNTALTVLTTPKAVAEAKERFARYELIPDFIVAEGRLSGQLILQTAVSQSSDLIIMGGYSNRPVFTVLLGETANEVLRQTAVPVLICQ